MGCSNVLICLCHSPLTLFYAVFDGLNKKPMAIATDKQCKKTCLRTLSRDHKTNFPAVLSLPEGGKTVIRQYAGCSPDVTVSQPRG